MCTYEAVQAFTWARDVRDIENELLLEGVAHMGHVTEEWMAAVEAFCETNPFDNVLSLGCERCGHVNCEFASVSIYTNTQTHTNTHT